MISNVASTLPGLLKRPIISVDSVVFDVKKANAILSKVHVDGLNERGEGNEGGRWSSLHRRTCKSLIFMVHHLEKFQSHSVPVQKQPGKIETDSCIQLGRSNPHLSVIFPGKR